MDGRTAGAEACRAITRKEQGLTKRDRIRLPRNAGSPKGRAS
jgi:hypothetical protein